MSEERLYRIELPVTERKYSVISGCESAEVFFENGMNIVQIPKMKYNRKIELVLK